MPGRHRWLPTPEPAILRKSDLLATLAAVDQDADSRQRVLNLEIQFRQWVDAHIQALPSANAEFDKFKTSPFVLLIYARKNAISRISRIEEEILPAKVFSSMETSAGRMIESVALPAYGWSPVISAMATPYSVLDGRKLSGDVLTLVTLKSGPSTLNDSVTENIADAVKNNAGIWASDAGVSEIEFSYGMLYGTQKKSSKKEWHVLRHLYEKIGSDAFLLTPERRWETRFRLDGVSVTATVRIGLDWWDYLGGGRRCAVEVWTALIRACVAPGDLDPQGHVYVIADLADIVSLADIPDDYNVSLLQRSQLPWLSFVARHFADLLIA